LDPIRSLLDKLPAPSRVAFAVACAQRVLPIYERTSTVIHSVIGEILAMGWATAAGAPFDRTQLNELLKRLDAATPDPQREGAKVSAPFWAVCSVASVLDTIHKETAEASRDAAFNAETAVESFGLEPDEATEEERTWQKQAISLVEQASPDTPTHADFDAITGQKPEWLLADEAETGDGMG
jgi:hypothetical protein